MAVFEDVARQPNGMPTGVTSDQPGNGIQAVPAHVLSRGVAQR
jgi:hypothetical protein